MPKAPRLTAQEAEKLLLDADFTLIRTNGSHRIYFKNGIRVVVPFHSGKILHPKIVRQVLDAINPAEEDSDNDII
ncbi:MULTISPECIES: type II toxin-antitoxin system HicA family toxin [Leptolyngbya]|uniref:Type II toxin-antitoxin system HicA family toxin n=1 Tax=Leptolyngbya boryana CZ1 TaxID=3060204 RepID=A0AA96X2K4_LEPBY|nr:MULTISPECIES: type II toxin-antitoxin system HicA family toxin [Leptolyngbya]MBD1855611.1 type II toxin-antitoxin system HicA family toxin [Leptolyngbya sp. FACHB-1624]MBD2366701.1 type II toxin-antitoxin system HicA family toxin [Leptolyngbya sp. FACHB-161]MBD2373285.1 type II toxin-antitoxin system HicA family toxin [Leptolyngbya sp. FACHB-238]MBD2397685.1 type II toxin-antitoxin system HicA family toxin [Leptolyngbya sp. FACHB-239]MBD2404829.1 type II toxin-antitoxin system HicA family t